MARRATAREEALEAMYGVYFCPYCVCFHEPPLHNDPADCELWYDWCNCGCAALWFTDGGGI